MDFCNILFMPEINNAFDIEKSKIYQVKILKSHVAFNIYDKILIYIDNGQTFN
jgi:hypothetical protein